MRYCAILLRSKFYSSVFDLHDEDRIAQSFNIFLDCELSELNQLISIAAIHVANQKKQSSRPVVNINYAVSPKV